MGRLVLTRKKGQAIVIDGPAVIRVVATRKGSTQLAVEAVCSTQVDREEVAEKKRPKEESA